MGFKIWGLLGASFSIMTGLLAEGLADPLSGGSGWIGAGMLASVLGWLLYVHLPAKDKQLEKKDQLLKEMLDHKDALKERILTNLSEKFTETIDKITKHCDEENKSWRNEVTSLVGAMQDLTTKVDDVARTGGRLSVVEQEQKRQGKKTLPQVGD